MSASPQLEDGYTRLANELLDAMCSLRMSGRCWRVFMAIVRLTYGWQKKADWITREQIVALTGISPSNVSHILNQLLRRRVIMRDGRLIGVQKDYTLWLDSVNSDTSVNFDTGVNSDTSVNFDTTSVNFDTKKCQFRHTPKKKEIITKERDRARKSVNSDTDLEHPAILVYWELTGKRPRRNTLQYDSIVRTVTDNPDKLSQWRETVQAWLLCGNKPTNVQGMLDWFKTGKRDNRTRAPPVPDQDGWTPEEWERVMERAKRMDEELKRWKKRQ